VNIYNRKRPVSQSYVNNQITDWSFKVDCILHNASQDYVYDTVVKDITLQVLEGYNGWSLFLKIDQKTDLVTKRLQNLFFFFKKELFFVMVKRERAKRSQ
jgi:hypothetical protein